MASPVAAFAPAVAAVREHVVPLMSSAALAWAPETWPVTNVWSGKRAATGLSADTPMNDNINIGTSSYFFFTPSKDATSVYVTINTCLQPHFTSEQDRLDPPQLTLSVSTSVREPNPASSSSQTRSVTLVEGFGAVTLNSSKEVYIGVTAKHISANGSVWNFELAASSDAPFHSWVNSTDEMSMVDSDTAAALLITRNLTALLPANQTEEEWEQQGGSLSVFIQNVNHTGINGLRQSYCGLTKNAQLSEGDPGAIAASLSNYLGTEVQQQFYVSRLNASSTYYGYLAQPKASNVPAIGGGGTVFAPMNFTTKRFANCAVIYGLSFCSFVAYAVPANPDTHDVPALAALYDNSTQAKYKNFNYSLQQIPCNTTASAQYSLAKTCKDCEVAYKNWLCAVSIPRCADWTPDPVTPAQQYLQPRNAAQKPIAATPDILPVLNDTLLDRIATNSSRNNDTIAQVIQPGPYSEILPCEELCYELVRSCPAALGFSCPTMGRGLEKSYAPKIAVPGGGLSCSEPGAVYGSDAVSRQTVTWLLVLSLLVVVGTLLEV